MEKSKKSKKNSAKTKRLKIRKVVFGIQFKFTLVMIAALGFVSLLITIAIYNQHEKKILDTMRLLGTASLNGAAKDAQIYFSNKHLLYSDKSRKFSPGMKRVLFKQKNDSLKNMIKYFSSEIKKEKILDVAFFVDNRSTDINADWKRIDQSEYWYFNRKNGFPFRQGKGRFRGRKDPLVEPSIFSHYMTNADLNPYIEVIKKSEVSRMYHFLFKNQPDYIIIGKPVFNKNSWPGIYKKYNEFKKASLFTKAERKKHIKSKNYYIKFFTKKLEKEGIEVKPGADLDELVIKSFRKDLSGIIGLFLHRKSFSKELKESRREIINLVVSIFIRAVFIAIFFPSFIIKALSKLSEGALKIGKGDFETRIDLEGTDELGRLADIFNSTAGNLQKAQELKIEKIRMEKELVTAQQIQEALLPESLPEIKGFEFAAYYSAQTESGGDYYDFIDVGENSLGITIADVSGHGVGSGLVMAMTRTLLHNYCEETDDIKMIFEKINKYLKDNTANNYFVTMFYGLLDLKSLKLSFSGAGHCPGLVLRGKELIELQAGGIALGATSNTTFSSLIKVKKTQLKKGDYFIQFTDGVDEAMDADENEFGIERFHEALLENSGKSPEEMIEGVVRRINVFTGRIPQHDDITIIILRVK